LLKEGRLRRRRRRGWFVQARDYLNHPACSRGSQAPLLQKEGNCASIIRSQFHRIYSQKLYRRISSACEFRRYCPRKSPTSPRTNVRFRVALQCCPTTCEYSPFSQSPSPFSRRALSKARLRFVSIV